VSVVRSCRFGNTIAAYAARKNGPIASARLQRQNIVKIPLLVFRSNQMIHTPRLKSKVGRGAERVDAESCV